MENTQLDADAPEVDLTAEKVRYCLARMRDMHGQGVMLIDDPLRRAVIALCKAWGEANGESDGKR